MSLDWLWRITSPNIPGGLYPELRIQIIEIKAKVHINSFSQANNLRLNCGFMNNGFNTQYPLLHRIGKQHEERDISHQQSQHQIERLTYHIKNHRFSSLHTAG